MAVMRVNENDYVVSAVTKFDNYGNRKMVVMNLTKGEFVHSGVYLGQYGEVRDVNNKEVKRLVKYCKTEGFKEYSAVGKE